MNKSKPAMQCPNCGKIAPQYAIALDWNFNANESRRRFWDLAIRTNGNKVLESMAIHQGVSQEVHFFTRTRCCSHCGDEYNTVELANESFYFLIQAVTELCDMLEASELAEIRAREYEESALCRLKNLRKRVEQVREKMEEQAEQNANAMLSVFDSQILTPSSAERTEARSPK